MDAQPDLQSLWERVGKLEKQNRQLRKMGVVVLIGIVSLFVTAQNHAQRVIEASEFRLVDKDGHLRGDLVAIPGDGQSRLVLSSADGKVEAYFATGAMGATLSLGKAASDTHTLLVSGSGEFGGLHIRGSGGKLDVNLDKNSGGPQLSIEDNEGYSSNLGRSDLVLSKTGKKEQTQAASVVLFDKDKKVLWSAP